MADCLQKKNDSEKLPKSVHEHCVWSIKGRWKWLIVYKKLIEKNYLNLFINSVYDQSTVDENGWLSTKKKNDSEKLPKSVHEHCLWSIKGRWKWLIIY